jgi:hypothetical protein
MIRSRHNHGYRTVLGIGLLLAAAGCSNRQPDETPLVAGISKTVGFILPSDTMIVAYRHRHDDKQGSPCSQLWIVRSTTSFAGPDRRTSQHRAKSPFASLRLLVEQATDGRVVIEAADRAACQCVEWQHGETICRLRQVQTCTGWVAALEAMSPQ